MPLVSLNLATVESLVLTELQAVLAALASPVVLVMAHEDDPAEQFVRLHSVVAGQGTARPFDADTRPVIIRATAQVTAADLRANGFALHTLAHAASTALAGKTLSGSPPGRPAGSPCTPTTRRSSRAMSAPT